MKKKKIRGKKYTQLKKLVPNEPVILEKAIEIVKKVSYSKFEGKVEAKINLNIDPKENEQNLRFTTTLPHPTGNEKKVLAFGEFKEKKFNLLKIIKADESYIQKLEKNEIVPFKDFEVVVASIEMMPKIARIAKILGPKGLMPSPKNGLVGDLDKVLENLDKGQIEIRNQPDNRVVHLVLGSVKSKDEDILENAKFVIEEIKKRKPTKIKKAFIESIYLKATLSPSIRIELK